MGEPATYIRRHEPGDLYGVAALTFMMVMYWLEHRRPVFLLGFALAYLLSSSYGVPCRSVAVRGTGSSGA
jgi:hypothetical protein